MADESGPKARPWPAWSRHNDGYATLAKYVSPLSIRGLALVDLDAVERQGRGGRRANRARVQLLYERLRRNRYAYQLEPWVSEGQRIRDARWIDRSGGTCIDFAVLFATMCVEAGLAPILVIRDNWQGPHHAFVLLDLARENLAKELPETPGGLGAFEHELPGGLETRIENGDVLPVDCTRANRVDGFSFEEAVVEGEKQLQGFARLHLVDVVHLQRSGEEPYGPPPKVTPVISRFLPPSSHFTEYPSRAEFVEQVRSARGRLVLWGPQGTGKSMLAHHIAASHSGGCGWFLAASDASTLITSLASAQARENALPAIDELSDSDRRELAATAVSYLNEAPEPWVVVLDNANCDPAELGPWLPDPSRERDQLLVITTTNDAWDLSGIRFEELGRLSDADVLADIGAPELVSIARGRPLLSKSFGRLLAEVGPDFAFAPADSAATSADREPDETQGPRLLWETARDHVGPKAVETAWLLAWLPPDEVPVEVLERLHPGAGDAVDDLVGMGLVSYRSSDAGEAGQAVSIHRLYVDAIRTDLQARDEVRHRSMITVLGHPDARDHLDQRGDQATIGALVTDLVGDYARAPAGGGELASAVRYAARLQELHGQIAASAQTYDLVAGRLLDELGIDPAHEASWPAVGDEVPDHKDDHDVLAECLHGRARASFQQAGHDETLSAALTDCRLAVRLREVWDDKLGAARSRALVGLIQRKQAANLDGEESRRALVAALDVIETSANERRELLGEAHPEVARSIFNLGGSYLLLAKTDDPERIKDHLDHAWDAYDAAYKIRLDVYQRKEKHPHVAACRNGKALVWYYRAVLQPGLDDVERVTCLREATDEAREALRVRTELDGRLDGSDSAKSTSLLAKILLVRYQMASAAGEAADVARETADELNRLALVRAGERA